MGILFSSHDDFPSQNRLSIELIGCRDLFRSIVTETDFHILTSLEGYIWS